MGRIACLESRRQGVRNRRLGRRRTELLLQGERDFIRNAQGNARPASGTLSRVTRHDMDPAFCKARALRRWAQGLYSPVASHRLTGIVQEKAGRAWAHQGVV